jgi:hypothetical protein
MTNKQPDSRKFISCPFPEPSRAYMISVGNIPIKAMIWRRQNEAAFAIVSADLRGENGDRYIHLSVSASSRINGKRQPTRQELEEAATASKLVLQNCEIMQGSNCVHIWSNEVTECVVPSLADELTRRMNEETPVDWE